MTSRAYTRSVTCMNATGDLMTLVREVPRMRHEHLAEAMSPIPGYLEHTPEHHPTIPATS